MTEPKKEELYPSTPLEKRAVEFVKKDDLAMFADDDTRMIYEYYYIKSAQHEGESLKEAIKKLIKPAKELLDLITHEDNHKRLKRVIDESEALIEKPNEAYADQQTAQKDQLISELVGYVVAYHGLSSLTSEEDIYIRSLIKKASNP